VGVLPRGLGGPRESSASRRRVSAFCREVSGAAESLRQSAEKPRRARRVFGNPPRGLRNRRESSAKRREVSPDAESLRQGAQRSRHSAERSRKPPRVFGRAPRGLGKVPRVLGKTPRVCGTRQQSSCSVIYYWMRCNWRRSAGRERPAQLFGNAEGDHCDWFAVAPSVLLDAVRQHDRRPRTARRVRSPSRRRRFASCPRGSRQQSERISPARVASAASPRPDPPTPGCGPRPRAGTCRCARPLRSSRSPWDRGRLPPGRRR
jgi:hypothetical protein